MYDQANSNEFFIMAEIKGADQIHNFPKEKIETPKNEELSINAPIKSVPLLITPDNHGATVMTTPILQCPVCLITSKASNEEIGSTMKPITEFVGAVTDILTPVALIIVIIWLRVQIKDLLQAFVGRLNDKNTELKIGPLELKVNTLKSEIKSLKEDAQVVASFSTAISSPLENLTNPISEELKKLSTEYKSVNISNWGERVKKKDELAGKMASIIIKDGISRDLLAHDEDEGIKVALATAIQVSPQIGDDDLILVAAPKVKRLNVQYRFMMAIAKLIQYDLIKPERLYGFKELCRIYRIGADSSLNDRIDRTEAEIDAVLNKKL